MAREALHGLPIDPADAIMIGDRLATEVAMGIQAGLSTALVLTGDSTRADIDALPEGARPVYVLETLDQVVPGAIWGGR